MPRGGAPPAGPSIEAYGATVLRLALGLVYVMHAHLALFVYGYQGTVRFQESLGLPAPEVGAAYVILAHGLGGLLLVLGVWVRWAALVNLPIMAGAFFLVHLKQGFFIGRDGGGYEYVLLVLAATLAQVFLGSGALALTGRR